MDSFVNMSVYASKDANQQYRPDGVHILIDYAISVFSDANSKHRVALGESNQERSFSVHGRGMPFQLAVWTTDMNVDIAKSWLRCTFRPAHDVGVSNTTSPLNPADTAVALRGVNLSHAPNNTAVNWEAYGMLERQYTDIWWTELGTLQNQGKFEIAVQVGLHYTDGSDPVYCIVDPEMDLDPRGR